MSGPVYAEISIETERILNFKYAVILRDSDGRQLKRTFADTRWGARRAARRMIRRHLHPKPSGVVEVVR